MTRLPFRAMLPLPVLMLSGLLLSCGEAEMDYYDQSQIRDLQVSRIDDGQVKVVYQPLMETMFYSPGIDVSAKDDRLVLRFPRCPVGDDCTVSHPARETGGEYTVILKDSGKRIFLDTKDGEEMIFPEPG